MFYSLHRVFVHRDSHHTVSDCSALNRHTYFALRMMKFLTLNRVVAVLRHLSKAICAVLDFVNADDFASSFLIFLQFID